MTREEIRLSLIRAGWKIADRSSRHLLVGSCGGLSIWAYECLTRTGDPTFQLIDGERALSYWVRVIPSPRVAAVLLNGYGEPLEASDAVTSQPYGMHHERREHGVSTQVP